MTPQARLAAWLYTGNGQYRGVANQQAAALIRAIEAGAVAVALARPTNPEPVFYAAFFATLDSGPDGRTE